jgi:hypothetical protein
MIEQSGNMRNCWEGENESNIQNVNREISTMKHNEKYLKTILTKILRADVLASFNMDNPFSNAKTYSRSSHLRIYYKGLKHSMVEDVFSPKDIVSGMVIRKDIPWSVLKNHVSKELVSTLSFLMTSRDFGNVIYGIQRLYHNHIIQVCTRAERIY